MRKKIISIIVALMIALTIPVVTPPSYVTTQASAQTLSQFKKKMRTMYKKIKKGMTYSQVKKILKKKGKVHMESDDYISYEFSFSYKPNDWYYCHYVTIYADFEEGELVEKTYFFD